MAGLTDFLRSAVPALASAAGTAVAGPIGAIAGPVIGAIGNGIFNAASVERERAWSEKMYNKYNSPQALVRQYQEAGINPALMFGQSAIPAPTTSTAAQAPENPFGDVVGMLGAIMQLDLIDEQKRGLRIGNDAAEYEYGLRLKYGDKLTANEVQKGLAEVRKLKADASISEYDRKFLKPLEMMLMKRQERGLQLDNIEREAAYNWYLAYGQYPDSNILNGFLGMIGRLFRGVEGSPQSYPLPSLE